MKTKFSLKNCKSDIVFLCTLIITIILCSVGCGRGKNDIVYFYDGDFALIEARREEVTSDYLAQEITKFAVDSGYSYDWSLSREELIAVDVANLKHQDRVFLFRTAKEFNVEFETEDITYQTISDTAIYNQIYQFTVDSQDAQVYIEGQKIEPDDDGIYQIIIKGDTKIVILAKPTSSFIVTNNLFTYTAERIEIGCDTEFKDVAKEEIIVKYYREVTMENEVEPIESGEYYVVISYIGSSYYIDDLHTTMTIQKATPVVTEWPDVHPGFVGDALSSFVFEGGSANVEGRFEWSRPQTIVQNDNLQHRLLFIPDNTNYQTISVLVTIEVNQYQNQLQIVREEKERLELLMQTFEFGHGNNLPKIGKYSNTIINYYSTDSLVSVDGDGSIQIIESVEDYMYVIYAIIIYNDAAEYCEFEFEISNYLYGDVVTQEKVQIEANNINMPNRAIIDFPLTAKSVYGSQITWESNDTTTISIVNNWAKVTRGEEDKTVTLTVTIANDNESATKTFDVLVPKGTTQTNTYRIYYELNEGTNNGSNPNTYQVGTQPSLQTPTKEGSEFLGWYLDQEFKGEAISSLPFGSSGDVRVYAKWSEATLTGITITTNPKTTYNAFEYFDATGMVVEAVYSNGVNVVITDYTVDKQQLVASDASVTVSYLTFTTNIDITVNKIDYDLTGIAFENGEKTYTGLVQTLEIAGTLPQGLSVSYSAGQTNVGSKVITATFTNSDEVNYNTPEAKDATITISPAKLVISANNISVKAGNEIPNFTASYQGFVNGETSEVLQGTLTFDCSATNTSPVGSYDINVSGVTATNYDIEFEKGTLTITTLDVTIEVVESSLTKTYNGEEQMFTATVTSGGTELPLTLLYKVNGADFTGATNAGTYQVTIEYSDEIYGQGSLQVTFTIEAKELEDSMFASIPMQAYTGSAVEPSVEGSFGGKDIILGTDFTVEYQNNTSEGSATAVVRGINNFSGTINLIFTIGDVDLTTVQTVKDYLTQTYTTLPTTVVTTYLDATIDWISSSTALVISSDGTVTYLALDEVQVVTLYGVITKNNAVEYFILEVEIPAKENNTQANLTNTLTTSDSSAALSTEELLEKFDTNYIATVISSVRIYDGRESTLKTGTSNDPGNFTLAMKAGYKATQVVIEAKAYNSSGGSITINNQTFDLTLDTATYTATFDATTLIEFTTTRRTFISSITIYFEEGSQEVIKLATPVATITDGVISWEAIPNATGYAIFADEEELGTVGRTETSYTLNIAAEASDKVYNIYVKALGDTSNYLDSDSSTAIEYEVKAGTVSSTYTLVTDVSTLKAGDVIVIAAAGYDFALSTTQNNNNRGRAQITKADNQLTFLADAGVETITLEAGTVEGTFAFKVIEGYLYAASGSANQLKSQATNNDNGSWLITISAEGIATIVAQGTNARNNLRYNDSNGLFSCYASGQQDVAIYKLTESN